MNSLIAHVHAVLATTPEHWQRLVSTLPIDLLTRPPAAGGWSALQSLQHLVDTERQVFPVRLQAILAGEDFVDFDPNQQHADIDALSPEQLVTTFVHARRDSLTLLS